MRRSERGGSNRASGGPGRAVLNAPAQPCAPPVRLSVCCCHARGAPRRAPPRPLYHSLRSGMPQAAARFRALYLARGRSSNDNKKMGAELTAGFLAERVSKAEAAPAAQRGLSSAATTCAPSSRPYRHPVWWMEQFHYVYYRQHCPSGLQVARCRLQTASQAASQTAASAKPCSPNRAASLPAADTL